MDSLLTVHFPAFAPGTPSLIPVSSISAFSDHCYRVAQAIQTDNRNIAELANKAKMGQAERDKIVRLLERGKSALTIEVEKMLELVTQSKGKISE